MQQPSDEVLINCPTDVLSAMTQHPLYIIMDALDECPNTSGMWSPQEHVLSLIEDLVNLHILKLHICVTSQPETDICNRLEPLRPRLVSLHDQAGHKDDIVKYIWSEVGVIAIDKRWWRMTRNWSSRHSLRRLMACKVLFFSLWCILSLSIIQVPMGVLSAGDAEALSPVDGSVLYWWTTRQLGWDLQTCPEGDS